MALKIVWKNPTPPPRNLFSVRRGAAGDESSKMYVVVYEYNVDERELIRGAGAKKPGWTLPATAEQAMQAVAVNDPSLRKF